MSTMHILIFTFGSILCNGSVDHAVVEGAGGDSEMEEEIEQLANQAMKQLFLTPPDTAIQDPSTPFEKVHDDVYCGDRPPLFGMPLSSGKVENMRECKQKCLSERGCRYFAFWVKLKKCETYGTCWSQIPDPKNKVSVYRRVTPCEMARDVYYEAITKAFDPHILRTLYMPFEWEKGLPRSDYPNPNFVCECTGIVWMTCSIFLNKETYEFPIIFHKFDPSQGGPEHMLPFRITKSELFPYGGENAILTFSEHRPGQAHVRAEIELPEYVIDRGMPIPGCIHISQCIAGTPGGQCGIQHRPFQSGEPVYVLKRAVLASKGENQPHLCMSLKGLRSHMLNQESETYSFKDPYGRKVDDRAELQADDYIIYWVFDDVGFSTGICGVGFSRAPAQRTSSGAGPSGAGPSGPSGSSPALSAGSPASAEGSEGEGKKKSKTKRGGKKHKKPRDLSDPRLTALLAAEAGSPGSDYEPRSAPEFSSLTLGEVGRISSDSALSLPGQSGAGPSGLQSQSDDSPEPFSDSPEIRPSSYPPTEKQKVVLSKFQIEQLRRSFEAAKARRASERSSGDEHTAVAEPQTPLDTKINFESSFTWLVSLLIFVALILYLLLISKTRTHEMYVDLLSHSEL